MRTALLAALLGSTAFIAAATAQQQPQVTPTIAPQGTTAAAAAVAECNRLIAYLEQARPANPGVTVEQARAWQQASQAQPCQENLRRLTENTRPASASQPQAVASPPSNQEATPGTPAAPAGPAQTGALPSPGLQVMKASDLEKMALYNARNEKMGDVDDVLIGPDNKAYVVVSHGGFLGLGQKQVALSADQIAMRGDRLVAENLTDEQIRALPEFKESANFREMDGEQTTSLRLTQ